MSNLYQYREIIDDRLQDRVFLTNRKLVVSDVYINKEFSGTVQQLFILKNWNELKKQISEDELWLRLKSYEYRQSDIVFNAENGILKERSDNTDLNTIYYYNLFWSSAAENPFINSLSLTFIIIIIVGAIVIFIILNFIKTPLLDSYFASDINENNNSLNLLKLIENRTQKQTEEWKATAINVSQQPKITKL